MEIVITDATQISADAFKNCDLIQKITLNEGITSIGASAFYECDSIAELVLPNSATSIGASAFYNCSNLLVLQTGETIYTIGQSAFSGCTNLLQLNSDNFGEFIIPNGIKTIGHYAFDGVVNMQSIKLDATLTSVGINAFNNCGGLTTVIYGGIDEENWSKISISSGNDLLVNATRTYYKGTMTITLSLGSVSWATSGYTLAVMFDNGTSTTLIKLEQNGDNYVCNIPDGYEVSEFKFVRIQGNDLNEANIKHQTNTFTTEMNTTYQLNSWTVATKN